MKNIGPSLACVLLCVGVVQCGIRARVELVGTTIGDLDIRSGQGELLASPFLGKVYFLALHLPGSAPFGGHGGGGIFGNMGGSNLLVKDFAYLVQFSKSVRFVRQARGESPRQCICMFVGKTGLVSYCLV